MFFVLILLLLPSLVTACATSCPPGFFGCNCQQCSNCGVEYPYENGCSGSSSYVCPNQPGCCLPIYRCFDGPLGNGECVSCRYTNQYTTSCINCLSAGVFNDPTDPSIWDGGLFCDLEYQGTTCGGPAQTTFCRCLDTTKVFVLPKPPPKSVGSTTDNYPTWRGLTLYGGPDGTTNLGLIANPYPTPDPLQYCCKTCTGTQFTGCQCDIACEAGCTNCFNNASAVYQVGAPCAWISSFRPLTNVALLASVFNDQIDAISGSNVGVFYNGPDLAGFMGSSFYQSYQASLASAIALLKTFGATRSASSNLAGLTLYPGVYKFTGAVVVSGSLTFSFPGLFVFIIPGTLSVAGSTIMATTNGAASCEVVWMVSGLVTLGSPTGAFSFIGSILNTAGITLNAQPYTPAAPTNTVNGRLLSQGTVQFLGDPTAASVAINSLDSCAAALTYCPNWSNPTCQGCDNSHYFANGTCVSCPATCPTCTGGTCKVCNSTGICLNPCPATKWGPLCANNCPSCPPQTSCVQGNCTCNNATNVYSHTANGCVSPACGLDRNHLCSDHGTCVTSAFNEFCVCDNAYNGSMCATNNTASDTCDCGVLWSSLSQTTRGFLPHMSLVIDLPGVSLFGANLGIPIGTTQQGEYLCYQDFQCDGFVTWQDTTYGRDTGQSEPVFSTVTLAVFFSNALSGSISSLPASTEITTHQIDRAGQNRCTDPSLATLYYYTNNLDVVKQYAGDVQSMQHAATPSLSGVVTSGGTAISSTDDCAGPDGYDVHNDCQAYNYWAVRHWRYVGHQFRLSPNSGCDLLPVVFKPESFCFKQRCLSLAGQTVPPCISGNGVRTGFCDINQAAADGSGFQCSCLTFQEGGFTNYPGSLQGLPGFMGQACEFPVPPFCVNSIQSLECNGVVGACQSRLEWSGQFYAENLQDFSDLQKFNYIPYCNCAGSGYSGQFCQTSVCSSCILSQGKCEPDGSCACYLGFVGNNCQYSAQGCLVADPSHVCSGFGICNPPTINQTQSTCTCTTDSAGTPYTGANCENYPCDASVMVFGHGVCVSGTASRCYPPYSTLSTACATDNCAPYGGYVIGTPPSGCQCSSPYENLFGGVPAIPSSCWPQCPKLNNHTCGVTGAGLCNQEQLGGTSRVAFCQCSTGYFLNTTTLLCDLYCLNGAIQQDGTCLCNAGFDTNQGLNPRCDHPVCNNLGTFNFSSSRCDCTSPYYWFTNCATSVCAINGGSVIPWLGGLSSSRCSCPLPYAPLNPSAPYDCSGNVCGPNGAISEVYTSTSPASSACRCLGQYRTLCTSTAPSCLNYCNASFCLNGGVPNPVNIALCSCPSPFAGAQCQLSTCNATNTVSIDTVNGICVCNPLYTGPTCGTTVVQALATAIANQPPAQQTITSTSSTVLSPAAIGGIAAGAVVGAVGIAVVVYFTVIKGTPTLLGTKAEKKPLFRR